ncbi:MAG: hypothetical protein V3R99_08795 [Thermoguttaceae bacterium]
MANDLLDFARMAGNDQVNVLGQDRAGMQDVSGLIHPTTKPLRDRKGLRTGELHDGILQFPLGGPAELTIVRIRSE